MSAGFVIYDLETTGLSRTDDEFIQVAAMRFRDGNPIPEDYFFSYAKPQKKISSFIQDYTGISNEDVKDAPPPIEVLRKFSKFVGNDTLIAHNGMSFDSKFFENTCRKNHIASRRVQSIDSIWLSKELFGKKSGHSLDKVIERCEISSANARRHDARGDVELLGKVISIMWKKLKMDFQASGFRRHETVLPELRDELIVEAEIPIYHICVGPYTRTQIRQMLADGMITNTTSICESNSEMWRLVGEFNF